MKKNNKIKKSKKNDNYKRNTLCINDEYIKRKDKITSFFLSKEFKPMTKKQLIGMLNIQGKDRLIFEKILNELSASRKNYI